MQSRVSVILPMYNTPIKLLERAVTSVINQTYSNFELIIVDDCSNDADSLEYLSLLENDKCANVIIHRKDKNGGVSDSLNIGVQKASGEYYCILDHDDYYENDYIEKMINCAEANDADLVVGGMKQVDPKGILVSTYPIDKADYELESYPWMSAVNLARLIRRSIVVDNDITYPVGAWTEDIIFTAKIYPFVKKAVTLPYEGYVNFINPDSSSRSSSYYALKLEQIPFDDIAGIIAKNKVNRYAYISGLMNNEMMLIGYTLTAFSDKRIRKQVIRQFQKYSKDLQCTQNEIVQYNIIVGRPVLEIRILEIIFNVTNRLGMASLGYWVTGLGIRYYYKKTE